MGVLYLALCAALAASPAAASASGMDARQAAADPDALYRDRETPASALAAERTWASRLAADPRDFESAWKLSRVRYWLGTNAPGADAARKAHLEAGIAAGKAAAALRADAPEGHFWMAANMGALADAHGLRQGLKYRTPIREALERARALQPAYLDGSPDRALGRWYFKVPGLFGGDLAKSESHLRAALRHNPQSVISLLFLGDTLAARGKKDEARRVLQAAIDAPADPDWAPEDARFKSDARQLLASLR